MFSPVDVRNLDEPYVHMQQIKDVYTTTIQGVKITVTRDDNNIGALMDGRLRIIVEATQDVRSLFGAAAEVFGTDDGRISEVNAR